MAQARLCAGLWPRALGGGARRERGAAAARRALRPIVPRHQKLFRHQGIYFLRSLRAVRRPSGRPHHRPAAVRDAVEQSRAAADRRSRSHAAHPHRPRLLPRQDRRQGRHADPCRAWGLSEGHRVEGRLLAEGRGAGTYGSQQELTNFACAVFKTDEEPLMQIKAAVVSERSGSFAIEIVELCEPRPDEVIVRVVASGMCQTDLHGRDGYFDNPYPAVYGHEGAGIVHAVGNAVRGLVPGDHVVMSYPWCGACANCRQQRQNYCVHGRSLKSGGTRADSSTLLSKNGAPVYSAFFQQSSFGTFALSQERYTVKVRGDAPLELL